MKGTFVLLCLLAVALPGVASEPATSSTCPSMATLSLSTSPTQEFPWETLEQDIPLSQDRLGSLPAPIFMAHPCCPSNHTQICSQACGGCGRGVCDDGACECLCC